MTFKNLFEKKSQDTKIVNFIDSYKDFLNKTSERQKNNIQEISAYIKKGIIFLKFQYTEKKKQLNLGKNQLVGALLSVQKYQFSTMAKNRTFR